MQMNYENMQKENVKIENEIEDESMAKRSRLMHLNMKSYLKSLEKFLK